MDRDVDESCIGIGQMKDKRAFYERSAPSAKQYRHWWRRHLGPLLWNVIGWVGVFLALWNLGSLVGSLSMPL
jgi:hypothetical protein